MESNKKARNFHNYKVWQDSVNFATLVYKTTAEMPWFEKKGQFLLRKEYCSGHEVKK